MINTDSQPNPDPKWQCSHFTMNRKNADVPHVLRELASQLETIGNPSILDLTFCQYWTGSGADLVFETQVSVYYDPGSGETLSTESVQ
jgi:hypothetical protein